MKVRLAQDADGPRVGELARASGFAVDGIDWSSVHPFWLVAGKAITAAARRGLDLT